MYYTDGLVLLGKEQTVMHDMIDRLTETGISDGMEINVEKTTTAIRISRKPSPLEMVMGKITTECQIFQLFV
jgi:hypothetical protein